MHKKVADAILNIGHLLFPRESVKSEWLREAHLGRKGSGLQKNKKGREAALALIHKGRSCKIFFPITQVSTDSNLDLAVLYGAMQGQGHLLTARYTTVFELVFLHGSTNQSLVIFPL